jgi:hypothetical protein
MVGWVVSRGVIVALLLVGGCGRTSLFGPPADDADSSSEDGEEPPGGCTPDLDSHTNDCDRDGIPDGDDPFPSDAERPGRARSDVIYVNSAYRLYVLAPEDDATPELIGELELLDGAGGQVTDIAIDRFGVLYAVTFSELYACDPERARCWALGELPTNSLAFLPVGVLDDDDDTLVSLAGATWMSVGLRGPELSPLALGNVAPGYSSSGDVVYDAYDTTWFSSPGNSSDFLVSILPESGASDLVVAGAFPSTVAFYGLAAFDEHIWIFDELGSIQRWHPYWNTIEIRNGGVGEGFWGAAANVESR